MDQRFRRGFTAAEKTELWDRWQRGSRSKRLGGRLASRHLPFIAKSHRTGDSSCTTASLAVGIDGHRARGDIERHCGTSIGMIDGQVTGPLAFDGEPRTEPQWRP